MKTLFLSALIVACAVRVHGQATSVPMSMRTVVPVTDTKTDNSEADGAHDALWAAWRAKPPEGITRTNRAYWEWQDKVFKKFAEDALTFAAKYPKDLRRWEAIVQMGFTPPWFITGFKPGFDAQPAQTNLVVDEAALSAYMVRQSKLNREVMLAEDTTPRQRDAAFTWMLTEATLAARKESKEPDVGQFEPLMEEVAARLPDKRGAELLGSYLDMLRRSAPDKAAAFEAKLVGKPMGKAIKEYAAKQEQAQAAWREARLRRMADLGTIKFTASDGREVDLAKLRGKVVLVDFWATWCEPCIEEIPDIVATYQKYHDRGFEVIGITLENAGVAEGDGAEAREKKLKTAKEKMEAFAKKNNMPWPQYFDGLYASNQFVMKYDIRGIGIPATFLLDKDGKVASTEARGAKLEAEVKRLLGL